MSKTTENTTPSSVNGSSHQFLFSKENYMIMFAGLAVIILGFILMSGGKSADPNVFNEAEIYSARRITIAPILILLGLVIEGYAIMKKPTA